ALAPRTAEQSNGPRFTFPVSLDHGDLPMSEQAERVQRKRKTPQLENKGSLINYKAQDGKDTCLGPLWYAEGRGVYDPTFGRVDVTKEQAEIHNRELDKAMLDGLDNQCEVGQGAMFYAHPERGQTSNIRVT